MIFEKEELSFSILDVLKLKQENVNSFNHSRNFDALSYRLSADTVISTKDQRLVLKDNSVTFASSGADYTRISRHDELIVVHFNTLNYFSKEIECCYPKETEKIKQLFFEIYEQWHKKEKGYKHRCSAILYEIFAELYKEMGKEKQKGGIITNSVKYLKEHFTDPDINVTTVAEQSNISEVYFRKLFKKQFGISPKKYIISSRIKYAIGLIELGYYSLSEIAAMSGFSDYKYFSTEFKRLMNVSPSKYFYNYYANLKNEDRH